MGMATAAATCKVLQLLSAAAAAAQRYMAVASAVGTAGFAPRISVVRRSMFYVTSTCDSHRAVADNVCADVR